MFTTLHLYTNSIHGPALIYSYVVVSRERRGPTVMCRVYLITHIPTYIHTNLTIYLPTYFPTYLLSIKFVSGIHASIVITCSSYSYILCKIKIISNSSLLCLGAGVGLQDREDVPCEPSGGP